MIEGHGDDMYRYKKEIKTNFSSNILSGADHTALMAHLAECGDMLGRYPEPEPYTLERIIAEREGVDAENVVVTNGATEAIYLTAQAYRGARSVIMGPTFSEYGDACRMHGHKVKTICGSEAMPECDMVWMCVPNNPTGEISEVRDRGQHCVADASYAEYTTAELTPAREFAAKPGQIMLSSMTKRFSVPGLRIGYMVAHKSTADKIRAQRMPWSVNAFAIEGAKWLLEHEHLYIIDAAGLNAEALRVSERLRGLGIEVMPTQTNFFLGRLPKGTSHELKEWLVEKHGLLIRDASNMEGLTERDFRVAVQQREANDKLTEAIGEFLREHNAE